MSGDGTGFFSVFFQMSRDGTDFFSVCSSRGQMTRPRFQREDSRMDEIRWPPRFLPPLDSVMV